MTPLVRLFVDDIVGTLSNVRVACLVPRPVTMALLATGRLDVPSRAESTVALMPDTALCTAVIADLTDVYDASPSVMVVLTGEP